MKSIYLVRHARAGWHDPSISDFERPLTNRGHEEAETMSQHLVRMGVTPDILVTSPAQRALETAEIFADAMSITRSDIVRKIEIYEGGSDELALIVQSLPDECTTAMLFGHNPVISHFVFWLTGKSVDSMETCGITRIDLDGDRWKETGYNSGTFVWYEYPEKE